MSSKKNRQENNPESDSEEEQGSDSDRDSDVDSDGNYVGDKELQADFEGRNPEDCDYHGIKALLRQLFLKSNVELGGLAQVIISQNYIGSVVKQCLDDGVDDDEDDEEDGADGVFGVTTIINITKRKDEAAVAQVRALLTSLADAGGGAAARALVRQILADDDKHVGLVINERIINIPAAISVPLFASLQTELTRAIAKGMPYSFDYLIWICKGFTAGDDGKSEPLFANEEERAIEPLALASFDVDVAEQADAAQWDADGGAMTPSRRVLIFEGKRFGELVRLMRESVEHLTGLPAS